MAVIRTTSVQSFMALSSDTKPTAGVPAGSRCFETDTGRSYMYDGAAWALERPGRYEADTFKILDAVVITAGTPAVVWTPAAGKIVRLLGFILSSNAQTALEFQDSGAAGTVIFKTGILATGLLIQVQLEDIGSGFKLAAADNTLNLDVTDTATVSGTLWGIEED